MANNINVFDKDGNSKTIAYEEIGGVLHQKNVLYNATGQPIGSTNGALDVMIQDQYSRAVESNFYNYVKAVTLVSPGVSMTFETYQLTLTTTTGLAVGDLFMMQEDGVHFEAFITAIDSGAGTITLDRKVNYIFSYDASAFIGKACICVNGSSTQKIFKIQPPTGASWDINRIVFSMQDNNAMDDSLFGGLDELTNGIVIRAFYDYSVGGEPTRSDIYCVAKSNFELGLSFNSIQYDDRAGGSGLYGMKAIKTFNSQQHSGVSVRLNGDNGDNLQIIVRDDLTGLSASRCMAIGHTVE